MHKWLGRLLTLLFPRSGIDAQLDRIEPRILERTALPRASVGLAHALAPLPYTHKLVQAAVQAAKYRGHSRAAWLLGAALVPFLAEELAERRVFGRFHEALVIPVPLYRARLRERGYNQAERIAAAIVAELADGGIVLAPHALIRTRKTPSQVTLTSRKARLTNVRNAFSVVSPEVVADSYVILFDDVTTTGATLLAAQKVLMEAGAREVLCVAVAH